MTAFWVSLSTIVFLGIVILKSYKLIIVYFGNQQQEIKNKLLEADEVYKKAHSLYEEYCNRIECLEVEAEKILKNAHDESHAIIKSAEQVISKMVSKKNHELTQRIFEYESQVKNRILLQYADIVANDLYSKAVD